MNNKIYLYPLWIRAWHILTAILFIILIVTGISMHYTGGKEHFLLVGFSRAIRWHNIAAILLIINYIIFVTGNVLTKNGKYYRLKKQNFWPDLRMQIRYYTTGIFKKEKHPFPVSEDRKFNPLQKLTYVLTMYVAMPLLIISGIGLLLPDITINRMFGVSGLLMTDILHITMAFLLSVFFLVHIYTCTLGSKPFSLFREIISGYHEMDENQ
ncbi:MAG: cytochrome b/b6 domain-containing protein [Bacteroidales bacterium]